MAQMIKSLPSKHEAMSLNLSTAKKKIKRCNLSKRWAVKAIYSYTA
jgi:FixJ family two-component response regulator